MAQSLVLATGAAAAGWAVDQTVAADRATADRTAFDRSGTLLAENTFAVDALGGQARFVDQMAAAAKLQALPRLPTDVAYQHFQPMHQRIPDDCPLDRGRAVADAHGKRYFGLGNEQGVDQRQFDAQPVTAAHIVGLGALFRLEHGQLVFKLLVARQLCRVDAGLAFAQVGPQFVVVFFEPCQVERQVMRHALRQRCQPLRQAGARGELGA